MTVPNVNLCIVTQECLYEVDVLMGDGWVGGGDGGWGYKKAVLLHSLELNSPSIVTRRFSYPAACCTRNRPLSGQHHVDLDREGGGGAKPLQYTMETGG